MAKGRRLPSSRSERLLGMGSYSFNHVHEHEHDHDHNNPSEISEFGEDEVWSMVDNSPDHHFHHPQPVVHGGAWTSRATTESGRKHGATGGANNRHVGGLSLAFEDETAQPKRILHQFGGPAGGPRGGRHHMGMATSAPVNVPDWSKILRVNSVEFMHDSDEDDRVGDSGMEPPHEYLARSRRTNARSVFEGVGRTLKGRDMSRVRDAVWSQTGFEG